MKTKNQKKMEWIYLFTGLFIAFLICGLFSSCAVVKTDFSNVAKKEATVYYYLPESIIKIRATAKVAIVYNADNTLTGSSNIVEESFVITSEMIADTKDLLSLNYKPNALMADDIKYSVNSKGLLETVNITTEDRTADIISKLAEAPQIILGTSTGAAKAANTIVKIKEYTSDFAIKVSEISSTAKTIKWNLVIINELGVDEQPKGIPANFEVSSVNTPSTSPSLSALINNSSSEINGILTRPIKNISLEIKSAVPGISFNNTLPSNVVVADVTKLIVIPVKRTPFVKRVNKIGIQDGIILSNEINKPSSVEGFVSIPINIAKAIVSIPGQLVQFRYDNTKRADELEKAKLNYEKSIQESQKYELTKNQEIEKVKLGVEKDNLSNSIELQKLKFELQTSLLEAEKKQLDAQKALDEIKNQLEELKQKK
ncbi:MAG TPA: hypothetical protein VK590_00685 [Saprospiraceae bacterium]|nr:hypothetical protein [Saprospiraceae bacterium]